MVQDILKGQQRIQEIEQEIKSLIENRRFLNATLDNLQDTVFVFEIATGKAVQWNRAFREISGYSDKEIAELQAPESYYSAADVAKAKSAIEGIKEGDSVIVEMSLITKSERRIPTEYIGALFHDDSGTPKHLIAVGRDVSDRKLTEQFLRESEMRYRLLIENIPSVVWVTDESGKTSYISPNVETVYGYTMMEIIEGGEALWFGRIHPEDQETVRQAFEDLFQKGTRFEVEYRIQRKDDRWIWIIDRANLIEETNGIPQAYGVFSDITDRKTAEQERVTLEEQLRHSEKLESLGLLAGGVAHDFNNQLAGILGYVELLKDFDIAKDQLVKTYLDQIDRAGRQAADLVLKLLTFARKGRYKVDTVDVHALIAEVIAILSHSADKRIKLLQELGARESRTVGDGGQIQNALLNLGINACHAMPEGGTLYFVTDTVTLDASDVVTRTADIPPGRYLIISVKDSGTGMSDYVKEHLFEPFFTTKDPGMGTGMGLASVYGTMRSHRGHINVESVLGEGTTFHLYLPLLAITESLPRISEQHHFPTAKGRILVIDDEKTICYTVSVMLEQLGYEVTSFCDGAAALEFFRNNAHRLDLVLLDIMMPKLSGRRLYEEMVKIAPHIKVIISTGYSIESESSAIFQIGEPAFLQKPFSKVQLAKKVSEVLRKNDKNN